MEQPPTPFHSKEWYRTRKFISIGFLLILIGCTMNLFFLTHVFIEAESKLIIDLATFAIFSIQSLTLYGIVHDSIVAFTVFAIFFTILSIGAIVEALSLNIPWTFVLISIAVTASAATLAYDLFKHHRAERLKIQANQLNPYRQFNAEV